MAALNLQEDQSTGTLTLRPNPWTRLLGAMGNLVWILVLLGFFLVPSFSGGRFNPESLIIVVIVLLFSVIPSLGAFLFTTLTFDRTSRTLTRTSRLLGLPIRSTTVSFTDLANLQVQLYRQSSGRSSHEAYRVVALDKSGARIPLNWDGKRDEMLALAQKISALSGAELLDQSDQPASQLTELMDRARQLGVPIPPSVQPIPATPSPDDDSTDTVSLPPAQPDSTTPEPPLEPASMADDSTATLGMEEPAPTPARDLRGMSVSGLEKMVAADSTDSDARYMLARAYHAQGNLDRAIAMYQETLKVDNTNAEAQNDLGVALQVRGKRADAEAAYRRAIALDPFSFTAHLNLALLLRALNRATEASAEFLQARQNAQGDAETRLAESASTGAKLEARLSGA
jgi:TolA-binding protein